ncbi:hypothetical protein TKK_0005893 [Trichogramma kaykai]|uniref:polyribonucleotide nucleotidyltransferase n=1 Tax=Trichogramma kaykai TaxID=54128 RepID=A0ABD2XG09_9HYME
MATLRLFKQNRLLFPASGRRINNKYASAQFNTDATPMSEAVVPFSNGKNMLLSTGKFARMADGCAVATLGDTSVMVTTVSKSHSSNNTSFVPLIVDYKQKAAAAGRIPTNFFRRELGQTEHEILTSRLIDRSLRPLFPKKYNYETQIMCNMLAIDGINDPDVLSINGAATALALSDIPWNGPVGAVRVGFIDKEIVINPTRREMSQSSLNLIITATKENLVVMLEGSADNISEEDLKRAIESGVKECQSIVQTIQKLQNSHGKKKRVLDPPNELSDEVKEAVKMLSEMKLREVFTDYKHDKLSRDNAIANIRNELMTAMKLSFPDLDLSAIVEYFSEVSKTVFRSLIFENNLRCDGRKLNELRTISCAADLFKPLHGSALFQRGQTQVLCTVTLDSPDSALKIDTVSMLASGIKEKNFFLHYEFPPYATNETGKSGIGRRETGHGALAERGLRSVVPKDYPFTIRLTSEVLESNGSSSMASVCGGSLALMDAGIPITSAAAGVAIGLMTNYNENTNSIEDYKILTDILGIEDYLGDMDFKVAGTKTGFTAVQADIKIPGLPLDIVFKSLEQAHSGKSQILDIMNKVISRPRTNKKDNMPVTESIDIPMHLRGRLLGFGGSNIKKIFLQTGVHINQDENFKFTLFAPNKSAMNEAKEMIESSIKEVKQPTLEFGGIYTAKIVELKDSGVLVTLYPTMQPALLPNSQLDQRKINHPSALNLKVGDELQVKYFGRDPASGQIRMSRKVLQTTNFVAKNFT